MPNLSASPLKSFSIPIAVPAADDIHPFWGEVWRAGGSLKQAGASVY